jgi:hypothetical protein
MRLVSVFFACAAFIMACGVSRAQFPQGSPLNTSGIQKDELHTNFRFGYIANDQFYKYDGQFGADGNLVPLRKSSLYALGNISVQTILINKSVFQPDRLWGTFEVGARTETAPSTYWELFARHQSAHNIDGIIRPESLYEMIGGRYRRGGLTLALAHVTRTAYLHYKTDAQAHDAISAGTLFRRAVTVDLDVHYVREDGGPRSGFVDYAVEPSVALTPKVSLFLNVGTVHDADQPNGVTESQVEIGIKAAT